MIVDGFLYDDKYIVIAEQNGISYETLRYRLSEGWDPEIASTQKPNTKTLKSVMADLAESNGINKVTYYGRVRNGWSLEKAATTPTMTRQEVGKMTKDRHYRLNPKYVALAKENGICYSTYKNRIDIGWDELEAATIKPRRNRRKKWVELAKENGIKPKTFYSRVNSLGWDEEVAATKPVK